MAAVMGGPSKMLDKVNRAQKINKSSTPGSRMIYHKKQPYIIVMMMSFSVVVNNPLSRCVLVSMVVPVPCVTVSVGETRMWR